MNGNNTAASNAMMASTHTISSNVKPRCPTSLIFRGRVVERDIGGDPAAAFLTVGAVRHDVIRTMLAGRTIQIAVVPGVVGNVAAPQIRPVPGADTRRLLDQRRQSLRRGGKPSGVEIEQVKRAGKTL